MKQQTFLTKRNIILFIIYSAIFIVVQGLLNNLRYGSFLQSETTPIIVNLVIFPIGLALALTYFDYWKETRRGATRK